VKQAAPIHYLGTCQPERHIEISSSDAISQISKYCNPSYWRTVAALVIVSHFSRFAKDAGNTLLQERVFCG